MNEEKIKIDYKEWQEIMRDYDYQTKQANEYLLEAQKYACELAKVQKENQKLKEQLETSERARKDVYDYINFLVIIDTQLAGGRFKDTIWGKELLELLDIDKGE